MPSGPSDDAAPPLSEREWRVLADLETNLGPIRVRRRLRTVRRALIVIVPLAGIAAAVSLAALATFTPSIAVAVTAVICTVAASVATAWVIGTRNTW
jgi:hypothetical protein